MNIRRQLLPRALLLTSACFLVSPSEGQTTITPTAGFGGGGTITTTGTTGAQMITIPANAGQQRGGNLFHSFSQFDVGQGDTAAFTPTGSTAAVNNIIARVYSPGASSINGSVTVDNTGNFAGANLFLINPAGVIFGKNASVSVPGDFVVSTANYVKLNDGTGVFYSDPTNAASGTDNLTSAPVSTFGFFKGTTPNNGGTGITVDGGASLVAGGSLQFVGGDFTAGASASLTVSKTSSVLGIFSGGQTSATADATVPYLTGGVANYSTAANFSKYGNVTLGTSTHGASLAASGTGGAVVIRGGKLVQVGTGATISANSKIAIQGDSFALSGTVSTQTGSIGIDTTGDVTLAGGSIASQGGAITLGQSSLVNLTLDSASSIKETAGTGGLLSISSTGTVTNAGTISTTGTSQAVQVSAKNVTLSGTISTQSGTINVDTANDMTLTGGSIASQGGAITLGQSSLVNLTLDSASSIKETAGTGGLLSISSTGTVNNAGTISTAGTSQAVQVSAKNVTLSGTISTQSGTINVDTVSDITLTGGTISTQGDALTLGQTNLRNLSLDSTSSIASVGGPITVTARGDIGLTGGSIVSTGTGSANTGNVNVTDASGNITLTQGAQIASISSGSGNAGNVTVNGGVTAEDSSKTLTITGTAQPIDAGTGAEPLNTGIFSVATGTGNAGAVNVRAIGNVVISAGGQIASVQTNASGGNAGAVTLTLNPNSLFDVNFNRLTIGGVTANSTTFTPIIYSGAANPLKNSGDVSINALSSTVELQQGAAIQTSTQDGQAGNVYLQAGSVTLDSYSAIQSVMSQTNPTDKATSGKTGSVTVLIFNLNPSNFAFTGPLSIADNAFIQTVANPKTSGFNPVGKVTVYAGSLTEGGVSVATQTDGYDYAYMVKGHTQIRMLNNATLGGANGTDISSGIAPTVQNLIGFSPSSNGTLPTPPAGNGIVLDGTLGGTAGPIIPVYADSTYTYTIGVNDGTLAGNNLFLSFSQFDLGINHPDPSNPSKVGPVNETALFDAPGVANILARVTDGKPSQIDGTLAEASGTTANLFLLNPSGMLFTANASLNLNGALTLSSANAIGLSDGGAFFSEINPLADSALTTDPGLFAGSVAAFEFTGTPPAPITFDTSTLSNGTSGDAQIQVIAGNISLEDNALLNAGQTLLFSAASPGVLTFASGNSLATFPSSFTSASQILDDSSFSALGTVAMSGGSVITVPSPNIASTILIRAGTFSLTDSLIVDQTTAQAGSLGGQVLIDVTGNASITSSTNSSFISTSTLGSSDGGSVQINAANLTITGGQNNIFTTGILSTAQPSNYYTSDSGYIPFIYANPSTATGTAGSITLDVSGQVNVSTFGQISTNTNGLGNAGRITIAGLGGINPQVAISGGGSVTSSTSLDNAAFSRAGAAGRVTINASSLSITGNPSLIASSAGTALNPSGPTGDGGNITITVAKQTGAGSGDISISNGGQISASSYNSGRSGTVLVQQKGATTGITINGAGSTSPTGIFAAEFSTGNSLGTQSNPAIKITTDSALTMKAGGEITTSAADTGNAGPIQISSGNLSINGTGADSSQATGILSSSTGNTLTGFNSAVTGNGGDITLNVTGDLSLTNGGSIAASSQTVGQAGTVTITQTGSTDLIDPATNPTVNGGLYINGGSISTAANGPGTTHPQNPNAGDISLNTQALTVTGTGSAITSSTLGASKAGDIKINGILGSQSAQFVTVKGGATIASNTGGAGDGGTITIKSGSLTIDGTGSAISTNAVAGTGGGGSINVTVKGNSNALGSIGDVILTHSGSISASSETTGDAGTVTITQSGSLDLTDLALNPATNGGLYLNGGLITTAANGPGSTLPSHANPGDLTLNVQALTMTNGSLVLSSTAGQSKAGDVTISGSLPGQKAQFVVLQNGAEIASETGGNNGSGAGGTITVGTGSLLVDGATISTSATGGVGNAGDISITAVSNNPSQLSTVILQNGGGIMSESQTRGSAGMITIQGDQLTVTGAGSAISTDAGAIGNAANTRGEIMLNGKKLLIEKSGLVTATTGGFSPGGTITATISNEVSLTAGGRIDASSTAPTGGGNGGSILIGSDPTQSTDDYGVNSPVTLSLFDHAVISADSQHTNGGNIGIHAQQISLENNSLISTSEPNGAANTLGGNITIRAGSLFYLNNSSFIDTNAGQGKGGNIKIDPQYVILNHSGIDAAGGDGNGNVDIQSTYVLSGDSFILATGIVSIDSLPLDLTGSLIALPANLTSEQTRLRESCARAVNHEFSSLIVVGRGGTETAPDELNGDVGDSESPALTPGDQKLR